MEDDPIMELTSNFDNQPVEKKALYVELCHLNEVFGYGNDFWAFVLDYGYYPERYATEEIAEITRLAKELHKKMVLLKHREAIAELKNVGIVVEVE